MYDAQFDINSIQSFRKQIDDILNISETYSKEHEELFEIILNLSKALSMFIDVKEQDLEHLIETHNPQEYIEEKLLLASNAMNQYKRDKINLAKANAYTWKL